MRARAFFQSAFDGGAALSERKGFAVEDEQEALRGSMESAVPLQNQSPLRL